MLLGQLYGKADSRKKNCTVSAVAMAGAIDKSVIILPWEEFK